MKCEACLVFEKTGCDTLARICLLGIAMPGLNQHETQLSKGQAKRKSNVHISNRNLETYLLLRKNEIITITWFLSIGLVVTLKNLSNRLV